MSITSTGLSEFELGPKGSKRSGLGPQKLDPELDRMISEAEAARLRATSRDTLRRQAPRRGYHPVLSGGGGNVKMRQIESNQGVGPTRPD